MIYITLIITSTPKPKDFQSSFVRYRDMSIIDCIYIEVNN